MTGQELKDLVAGLAIQSAKTDARFDEIDAQLAEIETRLINAEFSETGDDLDKLLDKTSKMLGISKSQGDVAEEFFINSLSETLKVGSIQYDELNKNMSKKTRIAEGKFDIVMINGKDIAIIETKYKAHQDDLDDFITRKYNNFKKLYPQYSDYSHHLGLASFYINDDTKQSALKNNVMVLQRKGDLIETTLAS